LCGSLPKLSRPGGHSVAAMDSALSTLAVGLAIGLGTVLSLVILAAI
jgi:hypothetical protein